MLKIEGRDASSLVETDLMSEDFEEDDLREWVIKNPKEIFDEDLMIIGRETGVEGIGDGIDVLAIDRRGNLVIIELKRNVLKGDVDFQILKYASYISRWDYEDTKQQFESFIKSDYGRKIYDEELTFTEKLESFCNDDYELNADQRIYLIGKKIRERIGSVVLWLRNKDIDARVIQFNLLKDEENIYFHPQKLVPTSSLEKFKTGAASKKEPWKIDGRSWHLEERTNDETRKILEKLDNLLKQKDLFDEVGWEQKHYVAYRIEGRNRVLLKTKKTLLWVDVRQILTQKINEEDIKDELGIESSHINFKPEWHSGQGQLKIKCDMEKGPDLEDLVNYVVSILEGVEEDKDASSSINKVEKSSS